MQISPPAAKAAYGAYGPYIPAPNPASDQPARTPMATGTTGTAMSPLLKHRDVIHIPHQGETLRALCVRSAKADDSKSFNVLPGFDGVALNALARNELGLVTGDLDRKEAFRLHHLIDPPSSLYGLHPVVQITGPNSMLRVAQLQYAPPEEAAVYLSEGTHRTCKDGVLMKADGTIHLFDSSTVTVAASLPKVAPPHTDTARRVDVASRERKADGPPAEAGVPTGRVRPREPGTMKEFCSTFKRLHIEDGDSSLALPDAGLLATLPRLAHRSMVEVPVEGQSPLRAICVGRDKCFSLPNPSFGAVACGPLDHDEIAMVANHGGFVLMYRTALPFQEAAAGIQAYVRANAKSLTVLHRSKSTYGTRDGQPAGALLTTWTTRGAVLREHDGSAAVDATGTLHQFEGDAARRFGYLDKASGQLVPLPDAEPTAMSLQT